MSRRWKPTVTPTPVNTYMTPRIARLVADTALFHRSTIAARKAAKGKNTAVTLRRFSNLVMTLSFPTFGVYMYAASGGLRTACYSSE